MRLASRILAGLSGIEAKALTANMARASILTLEPIGLGGVPNMASAIYTLQAECGHQPRLVYVDAESVPTGRRRLLWDYYRHHRRPRREHRRGMNGLSIPLYPLPQWAGWYAPVVVAPHEVLTDIRVAVTGSAHVGLPYTLSRKPFIVWVATRYMDELQGRAQAGDSWAEAVMNNSQWPRLLAQEVKVLRRAARVIALSPYTAQRILEDLPELEGRVDTILCPVDVNLFHQSDGLCENPIGSPFLLLTARILDPRKNVSMLLDAFAHITSIRPDLKLVIIGDPPRAVDAAKCDRLGLNKSVIFLSPKSHVELVPYYQSAELFVLPSTQEGLAISMLEAMACGLPVIATRCGGPESVIRDGVTGILAPNNDPEAYADSVLRVLNNPELLHGMRLAASHYAQRTCARKIVMAQLRRTFASVYPDYFPVSV